jgi:hypothetical protein
MANFPIKTGIHANALRNIPKLWNPDWFRRFVIDHLQNSDVRNSQNNVGVAVSGVEVTPSTLKTSGVQLSSLAPIAPFTVVANDTAGSASPTAIDETHLTSMVQVFTSSLNGAAPASGGGTTNFLRADGTWAAPPGGGGGGALPTTIPGLLLWYQANLFDSPAATPEAYFPNSAPNFFGLGGAISQSGTPGKVSAAQLNSLPTITLVGGEKYILSASGSQIGPILHKITVFVVANPSNLTGGSGFGNDILSGNATNALEIRVDNTGKFLLAQQNSALIGTSTTAVATVGSWSQFNATYDDSSGAFAFRSNRTANGSGTNALAISQPAVALLYWGGPTAVTLDWLGSIAEIIVYNRVLTGTEITNVENYLHTRWGV